MWKAIPIALLVGCAVLTPVPATSAGPLAGKGVCVDAGHGGTRSGAVNDDYELIEADINLDVAYGLKALLEADGATVYLTREGDDSVNNRNRPRYCDRTRADILISVHTNSVADSTWDGALGLYYKDEDKPLAAAIHDSMYTALRVTSPDPSAFRDFGLTRRRLSVLRGSIPSVLAEPLFMSNPGEAELLGTPIYDAEGTPDFDARRGQIAVAIHDGILHYFEAAQPTPTPTPVPKHAQQDPRDLPVPVTFSVESLRVASPD